jgi:hypothetical protein
MTRFVATVSVPGYLPMSDDRPVFDTAHEAWDYLSSERMRGEEAGNDDDDYSDIVDTLGALGTAAHWQGGAPMELGNIGPNGTGVIYGDTPGYDGSHDLGLAYCVAVAEDEDEDEDIAEEPDTCRNPVDGHWYVVSYGARPYEVHAGDCSTCAADEANA